MGDWEWKLTIETGQKGGPGSGHHGHAGRPGQRGGSAPGKGGGGISSETFYHLTGPENIESIRREGFRASESGELGAGVYLATDPEYLTDPRYSGASRLLTRVNVPLLTVESAPNLGLAIFRELYGREEGTVRWDNTSASEWFAPGGYNWEFLQGHVKDAGFGGMSLTGDAIPKNTVVFDPRDIEILGVEEIAGKN